MRVKKILPVVIGSLLSTSLYCTVVQADEAALQKQLNEQQRALVNSQNEIYQLHQELDALRNELSQMRGTGSTAKSSGSSKPAANINDAGYGPVTPMGNDNVALNKPSNASSGSSSSSSQANNDTLPGMTADAQAAYNAAYAKIQQNDLKAAKTAFRQYLDNYPENTLTPNAWYWLGQVQYSQAEYDDARLSFLNVARYNNTQKRPDALYKLGMISKLLGDNDKAARYFQLVLQSYPNDAASNLANRELQRLQK